MCSAPWVIDDVGVTGCEFGPPDKADVIVTAFNQRHLSEPIDKLHPKHVNIEMLGGREVGDVDCEMVEAAETHGHVGYPFRGYSSLIRKTT